VTPNQTRSRGINTASVNVKIPAEKVPLQYKERLTYSVH